MALSLSSTGGSYISRHLTSHPSPFASKSYRSVSWVLSYLSSSSCFAMFRRESEKGSCFLESILGRMPTFEAIISMLPTYLDLLLAIFSKEIVAMLEFSLASLAFLAIFCVPFDTTLLTMPLQNDSVDCSLMPDSEAWKSSVSNSSKELVLS
uniref:Uncharacterized protein n=1 Tax=Arundo donax TaxID=35708 RepID=A0A0A9DQ97_ARUDO